MLPEIIFRQLVLTDRTQHFFSNEYVGCVPRIKSSDISHFRLPENIFADKNTVLSTFECDFDLHQFHRQSQEKQQNHGLNEIFFKQKS